MQIAVTAEQKEACARAAAILRGLAEGLRATGSQNTVAAIEAYIATLQRIAAAAGAIDLTPEEKVQVEQASFLLEGPRNALLTADFRERSDKIQEDVDALGSLVTRYNTAASNS